MLMSEQILPGMGELHQHERHQSHAAGGQCGLKTQGSERHP
jgi:hypothetical protein